MLFSKFNAPYKLLNCFECASFDRQFYFFCFETRKRIKLKSVRLLLLIVLLAKMITANYGQLSEWNIATHAQQARIYVCVCVECSFYLPRWCFLRWSLCVCVLLIEDLQLCQPQPSCKNEERRMKENRPVELYAKAQQRPTTMLKHTLFCSVLFGYLYVLVPVALAWIAMWSVDALLILLFSSLWFMRMYACSCWCSCMCAFLLKPLVNVW